MSLDSVNGVSLVNMQLIYYHLINKINQVEKVGQVQHPHHAIKSASKSEHVFYV
jgi:hypothetical protein